MDIQKFRISQEGVCHGFLLSVGSKQNKKILRLQKHCRRWTDSVVRKPIIFSQPKIRRSNKWLTANYSQQRKKSSYIMIQFFFCWVQFAVNHLQLFFIWGREKGCCLLLSYQAACFLACTFYPRYLNVLILYLTEIYNKPPNYLLPF